MQKLNVFSNRLKFFHGVIFCRDNVFQHLHLINRDLTLLPCKKITFPFKENNIKSNAPYESVSFATLTSYKKYICQHVEV